MLHHVSHTFHEWCYEKLENHIICGIITGRRMVKGLEGKLYPRGMSEVLGYLWRVSRGADTDLFNLVTSDRTQGDGMKHQGEV